MGTVSSLRTTPVMSDPSAFRATGTCIVMRLLPATTSGCQPNQTMVYPCCCMKPSPASVSALMLPILRGTAGNIGVDEGKAALVAAIEDVEEQHAVRPGAISGPQDLDVGGVLDHALGIFRRQRDVLDHGVRRQLRIDLAIGPADLTAPARSRRSPDRSAR